MKPAINTIKLKKNNINFWCQLALVAIVACWGGSFVSTRVLLDNGLTAVETYVYRFALAYLLLLLIDHKRIMADNWRDELWFLVCGLCGGSIYFITENTALNYTLTTNVSLITTTSPLFTALFVGLLYRSDRPTWGMVLGSVVAFLGVGLVIFNSSFVMKINPLGDMLALSAAVSFGIYSVAMRRLNAFYSSIFITRKTFFYGVLTAIPFMCFEPELVSPTVLLRTEVWANLLFLGIFCSVVAYVVWAWSIKELGTIRANNFLYFQPIWTLIFSAIILSEKITIIGVTGCGLILVGVWLSDYLGRKSHV